MDKRVGQAIEGMEALVSDDDALKLAAACAQDDGEIDVGDAEMAVAWAQDVRLKDGILQNVLLGRMRIAGFDGNEPRFRINQRGVKYVEQELLPH